MNTREYFGNAIQLAHTLFSIHAWQECFTIGTRYRLIIMRGMASLIARGVLDLRTLPGDWRSNAAHCELEPLLLQTDVASIVGPLCNPIMMRVIVTASAKQNLAFVRGLGLMRFDVAT